MMQWASILHTPLPACSLPKTYICKMLHAEQSYIFLISTLAMDSAR